MRLAQRLAGLVLLAAVLSACIPNPPPGRGPNPNLTVSTVVSGLDHPWDIAFTPDDNWMIYDERAGSIWAKPFPTGAPVLLGTVSDVVVHGEGGLLGLAVDPSFASNHFLYACYDSSSDVRVVRFTVAGDLAAGSLAIDTAIVTGIPVNTASGLHSGCRPRFRPGTSPPQLFVGTGDSHTDGSIADNVFSLGGKILCVTTDGNPCANNPGVVNSSLAVDDRIWSWGHRNVQGIAFTPSGGGYSVEHGTDRDDEVNVLFQGDFGWNPVPRLRRVEAHDLTGLDRRGVELGRSHHRPVRCDDPHRKSVAGLAGGLGGCGAESPGVARRVLRRLPRLQVDRHHLQHAWGGIGSEAPSRAPTAISTSLPTTVEATT